MFDRIAGPYDLMNRVMTAGLDRRWRAIAARESRRRPRRDGARRVLRHRRPRARAGAPRRSQRPGDRASTSRPRCCGAPRASRRARTRRRSSGCAATRPRCRSRDNSFAAATIAFGLRNLPDPEAGLRELRARRAARAGASCCLEITRPEHGALKGFYSLWFDRGIPALGKVFDRGGAYSYLPASVRRFPGPDELGEAFHRAGMTDVRYRLLAGGIVALHVGEVVA